MDLRQLRSFVEVARTGTYAAAGDHLHLTQPAVWKHVHNLEADLGVALFERAGRTVRLTAAGLLLLEHAQQLLESAARMHDLAGDVRQGRSGTVTVGCVAPHVLGFLGPIVGAFHRAHPAVSIRLIDVNLLSPPAGGEPFASLLLSGAVDMVTGPQVAGAEAFPLYEVQVVCAVPPRHPWRRSARIEVSRLRDQPLLVGPSNYLSRTQLERASRAAGFEPRIEVESASPLVLAELGAQGLGVPVMASDALPSPRRPYPELVDDTGPLATTVWLSTRSVATLMPVAAAFVDVARAASTNTGYA